MKAAVKDILFEVGALVGLWALQCYIVAETACVDCEALRAEVCVGGSTVLSQPVWHREFALSFTVEASFCQHSVCLTVVLQPLSLLNQGGGRMFALDVS